MTVDRSSNLRNRPFEAYGTYHAGCGRGEAPVPAHRHDTRPLLPPSAAGPVVDVGCGRGELVWLLQADGFDAEGIDVSPERVALAHAAGVARVRQGDFRAILSTRPDHYASITATDVLEHPTKPETLQAFDAVAAALAPGGAFVRRDLNAVCSLGRHIRNGDFTHQTSFIARSIDQFVAAAGFRSALSHSFPPVAHGVSSAAPAVVRQLASAAFRASACYRIAVAATTGRMCGHVVTQNSTFAIPDAVKLATPTGKDPA